MRENVGWEDLEIKQRTSNVNRQNPVKVTDIAKTGEVDLYVARGLPCYTVKDLCIYKIRAGPPHPFEKEIYIRKKNLHDCT